MSRRAALVLIGTALAAAAGATSAERADEPPGAASLSRIIEPLERLRGLRFTEAPATKQVTRTEARLKLNELLRKEYPPGRLAAEQETYVYLGFIESGKDLEKMFLDLLEEQVAGFYDPETRTLYVIPGPIAGTVALAHEMAHALADQHYDLAGMQARSRENDDRTIALAALVEGEATMVTSLWVFQSSMDPTLPPLDLGDPEDLITAASAGLDDVPRFVRESLTFPYLKGAEWAAEVMRSGGGLKALDAFFREPPDSTEQILHPERSLAPRDLPSIIDPGLLEAARQASGTAIKQDTMGEFGIRHLLYGCGEEAAERAGEGWDGDRYLLARGPDGPDLTWLSVWDSEADAEEFEACLRSWLGGRQSDAGAFAVRREGAVVAAAERGDGPAGRVALLLGRSTEGIERR